MFATESERKRLHHAISTPERLAGNSLYLFRLPSLKIKVSVLKSPLIFSINELCKQRIGLYASFFVLLDITS